MPTVSERQAVAGSHQSIKVNKNVKDLVVTTPRWPKDTKSSTRRAWFVNHFDNITTCSVNQSKYSNQLSLHHGAYLTAVQGHLSYGIRHKRQTSSTIPPPRLMYYKSIVRTFRHNDSPTTGLVLGFKCIMSFPPAANPEDHLEHKAHFLFLQPPSNTHWPHSLHMTNPQYFARMGDAHHETEEYSF